MIDARAQHAPASAPGLIASAVAVAGTQAEVAARCGVSAEYLRLLASGQRTMSYSLQVTLEQIARSAPPARPLPAASDQ